MASSVLLYQEDTLLVYYLCFNYCLSRASKKFQSVKWCLICPGMTTHNHQYCSTGQLDQPRTKHCYSSFLCRVSSYEQPHFRNFEFWKGKKRLVHFKRCSAFPKMIPFIEQLCGWSWDGLQIMCAYMLVLPLQIDSQNHKPCRFWSAMFWRKI